MIKWTEIKQSITLQVAGEENIKIYTETQNIET